jgi:hypothetical protein
MKAVGIGTRIKHPEYGDGIICKIGLSAMEVSFFSGGLREIDRTDECEIVEVVEPETSAISFEEVEGALLKILRENVELIEKVPLGDRWKGGTLVLEPEDENLQVKEIPIESFFHKIVMVRDRLRVLEQNINSHKKLDDEDKVHLQQYISRAYGSLTTFNVLFKHKDDQFSSK